MEVKSYLKLIVIATAILACSTTKQNQQLSSSGSILVSRAVPKITDNLPSLFLGFIPVNTKNYNLEFNSKDNVLVMSDLSGSKISFKVIDSSLTPGVYTSSLVESNPTWHANDSYFTNRQLDVPENGSKERFLKGVLGKTAVFFDQDLIIHSGKLHTTEVKGIRVSDEDLNQIVNNLKSNVTLVSK